MSSVRHCCRRCDSLTNRKSVKLSRERPDQRFQLLSAVSTRCCNVNNLQLHQQDVVVVVFVCLTQPSNLTYKYFPSRRAWSHVRSGQPKCHPLCEGRQRDRPLSRGRSPNSPAQICPPKKITARRISCRILLDLNPLEIRSAAELFSIFIAFHHYALLIFCIFSQSAYKLLLCGS